MDEQGDEPLGDDEGSTERGRTTESARQWTDAAMMRRLAKLGATNEQLEQAWKALRREQVALLRSVVRLEEVFDAQTEMLPRIERMQADNRAAFVVARRELRRALVARVSELRQGSGGGSEGGEPEHERPPIPPI